MERVEVIVVGAGPVGMTASLLLSYCGIDHRVVERRPGLHDAPQAHVLKTRTLEVYRTLGLDEAIHRMATPREQLRYINWFTDLAQEKLGSLDLASVRHPAMLAQLSPTRFANLPQDELEELLLDAVRANKVEVAFDQSCVGVEADNEGAVVILRDGRTGQEQRIHARYVLAADGAGSGIRRDAGLQMIGPSSIAHFITIYFKSDLTRFMSDRPANVNWGLDPGAPGTLIVHGMERRAVFMNPYDPELESPADYPVDRCQRIIAQVLGDADHPVDIQSVGNWTMTAQVADHYRQGPVFLIGDAAHRFPPTGGLGLNTGVQDVFNLIWKLALVLEGRADPALLDSYESETRPVAEANRDQSLNNQLRNDLVHEAIGLTGEIAADRAALAALRAAGPDGEARRARLQAAIDDQLPHYMSFGLDLGYSYDAGAVIPDGTARPWVDTKTYLPNTRPGSRLPHCWLRRDGESVSTLDLLSYHGFTLLTGLGDWAPAARQAEERWGVPVTWHGVGAGLQLADPEGQWAKLRGHGETGALLVRPDGHVAWRSMAEPDDPAGVLQAVLEELLQFNSAEVRRSGAA